jgi:membrane associated rhomboid family serine protease
MGIHDRDYYRDDAGAAGWLGGDRAACKLLIGLNIVVYVLQVLTQDPRDGGGGLTELFGLSANRALWHFELWRFVTYGFCHAVDNPFHIFFNMLFLWWFGGVLESNYYNTREFLKFYLTAVVFAGLVSVGLELVTRQPALVIGASGAVLAAMTVFAFFEPHHKILIFFVIPVEIRWIVIAYAVFNLHPLLMQLAGRPGMSSVAHAAHTGGLLYGYIYKRLGIRIGWPTSFRLPRGASLFKTRSRPNIRLYDPADDDDLDRRVDEVLAKITAHGESSLTDSERQLLKDASRRYKNR